MCSGAILAAPATGAALAAGLGARALHLLAVCCRFAGQPIGYSALATRAGLGQESCFQLLIDLQFAGLIWYRSAGHPLRVHSQAFALVALPAPSIVCCQCGGAARRCRCRGPFWQLLGTAGIAYHIPAPGQPGVYYAQPDPARFACQEAAQAEAHRRNMAEVAAA